MVTNNDLFPVLSAKDTAVLLKQEKKGGKYRESFIEALEKLEVGGSTWVSKGVISNQTIRKYCDEVDTRAFAISSVTLKGEFQGYRIVRKA